MTGTFSDGAHKNTVGFLTMQNLLEARDLTKSYSRATRLLSGNGGESRFVAVDGVSFSVAAGETFAVVGESGCGKTTLARMLLRLIEPDSGAIQFDWYDLFWLGGEALGRERRGCEMLFRRLFCGACT